MRGKFYSIVNVILVVMAILSAVLLPTAFILIYTKTVTYKAVSGIAVWYTGIAGLLLVISYYFLTPKK